MERGKFFLLKLSGVLNDINKGIIFVTNPFPSSDSQGGCWSSVGRARGSSGKFTSLTVESFGARPGWQVILKSYF